MCLLWVLEEGAGLVVNTRLETTLSFRVPSAKYWLIPDTPSSDVIRHTFIRVKIREISCSQMRRFNSTNKFDLRCGSKK